MTAILLAILLLYGAPALAAEPDSYVATGGRIIDQQTYTGSWPEAYLQILNNHSELIHAYQKRTLEYYLKDQYVQVPCKPVSLEDISADGIPELIFMEAENEERGDLYIYSFNGTATGCVLYVPGITRLGYDDVGMGFDVYLSSADGGTLVLEYDEYEWPWVLQLTPDTFGRYMLRDYLRAEYDNSGLDNDRFYRNGSPVSRDDYDTALRTMRNGRMLTLSAYTTDDASHYGFTMSWEDAAEFCRSSRDSIDCGLP